MKPITRQVKTGGVWNPWSPRVETKDTWKRTYIVHIVYLYVPYFVTLKNNSFPGRMDFSKAKLWMETEA